MRGGKLVLLVVVVAVVSSAVIAPVAGGVARANDTSADHTDTRNIEHSADGLTAVPGGEHSSSAPSSVDGDAQPTSAASDHVPECAAEPPGGFADPSEDTSETIGWVDGYWYNEPLDIEGELENPLDESQVDDIIARTAARVETLRCLNLDEVPSFTTSTFEEQIEQSERYYAGLADSDRNFINAQMQTMLLVGTETDAVELQAQQQGSFGIAYYSSAQNTMIFIVEEPGEIRIDEVTLAHELVHALQFQNFDLRGSYGRETNDGTIAGRTTIEGGASLVDQLYEQRCGGEWRGECIQFEIEPPEPPNWGEYLNQYAPYSTPLVAQTKEEDGWDGVNELLESPPDSTVEAIYPEMYGEFERAEVTVQDQSTDDWELVGAPPYGNTEYDVIGQHGVVGMVVAPSYDNGGSVSTVPTSEQFFEEHSGGLFNYDIPSARSWRGDKMVAYASEDGNRGAVWKTVWVNESEAAEFRQAYEQIIDFQDGQLAEGYENVYTFEEAQNYSMALALEQREDRLTIVTAPTVEDLTSIHDVELLEPPDPTPTPTPQETPANQNSDETPEQESPSAEESTATRDGEPTGEDSSDGDGAGFGVGVGTVALAVTALLAHRRRTR